MGKLQKIYNKMPIFIQNIMTTMAGYKKNRSRYGREYYEHLEFLNNFDKLTMKEKKEAIVNLLSVRPIHGDLSPNNVIVTEDGDIVFIDL
jgi:RIO-like serine/threonine protein kinase